MADMLFTDAERALNPDYIAGITSRETSDKAPVRVASTAAINTANVDTTAFDGVALVVRDRVLLKDQADAKQNGIWYVATAAVAGVLARAEDFDASVEAFSGSRVLVREGTVNKGLLFKLETAAGQSKAVIGTDNIVFAVIPANVGAGAVTAAMLAAAVAGAGIINNGTSLGIDLAPVPGLEFDAGGAGGRIRVFADPTSLELVGTGLRSKSADVDAPGADSVGSAAGVVNTAFTTNSIIAASRLVAGTRVKLKAFGKVTAGGGAIDLRLTARLGGVAIGEQTAVVDPATNDAFCIEAEAIIIAPGAGGLFSGSSSAQIGSAARTGTNVGSVVDTTIANTVDLLVSWAAGAGEAVALNGWTVDLIG